MTKKQLDLMTKRSIIPIRVIELQVSAMEIASRATKDRFASERLVKQTSGILVCVFACLCVCVLLNLVMCIE